MLRMTRPWTIDAVHRAPCRLVIREPLDDDPVDKACFTFMKSLEPIASFTFRGPIIYAIIERHGA